MNKAKIIDDLSEGIDKVVKLIVFCAIVSMIVVITLQIISRVLFDALTWGEEASRYLLVWSTFLGATLAYKRGMHIAITFIVESLPKKISKLMKLLSIVLSMVFFFIAIKYGVDYITMQTYQVSAALRIPMKYVYLVIPVSFGIMFIHAIAAFINELFISEGGLE